jgi:hypothetical protein
MRGRSDRLGRGMPRRPCGELWARALCLALPFVSACTTPRAPPRPAAARTERPPAKNPLLETAAPEPPEPDVCPYDAYYEDTSFFVSLDAKESRGGSRFQGKDEGACGDTTLTLETDEKGATLTATRAGKSALVFRDPSDFVMLEGCVDLTGDGSPELVVRRPSASGAPESTEVISLEATPRSLLKVPFDLELRRTKQGPFGYELVNDDGIVFTHATLPVVFAQRDGRFQRIGSGEREYWSARRELVKGVLECHAKTPGPVPRPFVNMWFSSSLYLGDWDERRATFEIDGMQSIELELARPALVKRLDGETQAPPLPTNVWLASRSATAEIKKALAELSALPALPLTTEVEELPASDDPNEPAPPKGLRYLNRPKGAGALLERCGKWTVEQVNGVEVSAHVRLKNPEGRYAGSIMPSVVIGDVSAEWCFDLTGDGTPELLVTETSGGAHCCHTYRVISLGATPELILEFPAGNAWLEGPENLDGTGPYELVGRDDFLTADASASPYAETYFVPVVFALEKGKYVRRTRRFKRFLEKERSELAAEYAEDGTGLTMDPSGWMALSMLIGDWEKVKGRLPIEPSARAWFDPETTLKKIQNDIER